MDKIFNQDEIDILTKAITNDLSQPYAKWSSEDKLSWKEMGYKTPKMDKTGKINE